MGNFFSRTLDYFFPALDFDDGQCAICIGPHETKSRPKCGHVFCYQCLTQWSHIKLECPTCKEPFKSFNHQAIGSPPTGNYDSVFKPDPPAITNNRATSSEEREIRADLRIYFQLIIDIHQQRLERIRLMIRSGLQKQPNAIHTEMTIEIRENVQIVLALDQLEWLLPIIGRFSAETRNLIFYAFRAGIGLINS